MIMGIQPVDDLTGDLAASGNHPAGETILRVTFYTVTDCCVCPIWEYSHYRIRFANPLMLNLKIYLLVSYFIPSLSVS